MSNWSEAVAVHQARIAAPSYDEKQAVCVLVKCRECGKQARATLPRPEGVPCWDKACRRGTLEKADRE